MYLSFSARGYGPAGVTALDQQIPDQETAFHDPTIFAAMLIAHEITQSEALIAPVQTAPENGVAAHVGLERLVIAGDDVGAAAPGVVLFVAGTKGRKCDTTGQMRLRMITLVPAKKSLHLLVVHHAPFFL